MSAGGVLRTPRQLPMLNPQAMKAAQAVAQNDEVANILKGLKLDKKFFFDRIRGEPLQALRPALPADLNNGAVEECSRAQRKRDSIRRATRRKMTIMNTSSSKEVDFDIYINEAVMPVLAQALDALTRQLNRMREQGDMLDPKVRARFNPLTWLGQQLLRRHPKCARTPRRQLLYKNFKDWADWERGRRELLRKKDDVSEVFGHFVLRGGVAYETIWDVVISVDDTLKLEGTVKNNVEMERAMKGMHLEGAQHKWKHRFESGVVWTFDEFWYHFANTVLHNDIVPFTIIARGDAAKAQEAREHEEWIEKMRHAEEEKQAEEEEKRRLTQEYAVLYDQLVADPQIQCMINDGKILTGDDVRQGDVGYEFEITPHGRHVTLLADFMVLLGLESAKKQETRGATTTAAVQVSGMLRSSAKAQNIAGATGEERYWDDGLASAWAMLQKVHHVELCDGVVDGQLLKQVLVPPVGFIMLKGKVEYEVERKAEKGDDSDDDLGFGIESDEKPTMEQLAQRLGMTMSRLDFLHKLFESFLQPEEPGGPAPVCLYPECPASLNKDQMRALVSEVEPNLSAAQFDARFKRIDQDGSGMIEFDEFAHWVHSSDVRIAGATNIKMTFDEIANRYQEPVELIRYLHSCFQDQLPDGVVDGYPVEPVGLCKEDAKFLAGIITPGFDAEEFDENFEIVDSGSRQPGFCDFDEFVELLELEDLPAELRDRFEDDN